MKIYYYQTEGAAPQPATTAPSTSTTQPSTSTVAAVAANPNRYPLGTPWNVPSTNMQQTVETEPVASGSGFQLPGWGYNNPPPPNNPTEPVASGSGFMLPGWGYNPPPPNTPNRGRQNALSTRNNLFQPYTSPGKENKYILTLF